MSMFSYIEDKVFTSDTEQKVFTTKNAEDLQTQTISIAATTSIPTSKKYAC